VSPSSRRSSTLPVKRELGEYKRVQISQNQELQLTFIRPLSYSKWTAVNALDMGTPVTLIGEAVFARCLSSLKDERVRASKVLPAPPREAFGGDKQQFIEWVAGSDIYLI
jgi:hypothetical protein